MNRATVKELYTKIAKKILHTQILDDIALEKEFIKKDIESPEFSKKLSSIIENKDYSCQSVYFLCQDILTQIDRKHNSANWLYRVFQFTLSKSFAEAVDPSVKDISDNCRKAFLFYLEILRVISYFQKIVR